MNNSKNLLISEPPLQVIPSLAVALKNSDKAIILQQIHYWLQRSNNIVDGHRWVFNTAKGWQKQFPWITEKTVQRYLKDLCDRGLLITGNYNKANFDRTKWYRIDYDALDKLGNSIGTDSPNGKEPTVPMEGDSQYQPIPIDYTENTHKTTSNNNKFKSDNLNKTHYQEEFETLWQAYPKYKKQGKQIAFRSYCRWRKGDKANTFEKAQKQLSNYLKYLKLKNVKTEYIKAAKTWFSNIDDEYDITDTSLFKYLYCKDKNGKSKYLNCVPNGYVLQPGEYFGPKPQRSIWSNIKAKPESANTADTGELKDFFTNFERNNGIADDNESKGMQDEHNQTF